MRDPSRYSDDRVEYLIALRDDPASSDQDVADATRALREITTYRQRWGMRPKPHLLHAAGAWRCFEAAALAFSGAERKACRLRNQAGARYVDAMNGPRLVRIDRLCKMRRVFYARITEN